MTTLRKFNEFRNNLLLDFKTIIPKEDTITITISLLVDSQDFQDHQEVVVEEVAEVVVVAAVAMVGAGEDIGRDNREIWRHKVELGENNNNIN